MSLSTAPLFAPLCLSILDQFEQAQGASCICSVRAKPLSERLLRASNEVQRIKRFIWDWIGKDAHALAYAADRNSVVLVDSYSWLGSGKSPTDICPDSIEECVGQLRGDWS